MAWLRFLMLESETGQPSRCVKGYKLQRRVRHFVNIQSGAAILMGRAKYCIATLLTVSAYLACCPEIAENAIPETVVVTAEARDSAQSIDAGEIAALHATTVPDALNDAIPSAFVSD